MLSVEIFDKAFLELLDPNQEMNLLGTFGGFLEGLIWNHSHQDLTFNTLGNRKSWRWSSANGASLLSQQTNIANGMAYDHQGRILICEQIGYRIARSDRNFDHYEILADEFEGNHFNSPNDITIYSNGTIYFTDPHYGRRPSRHGRFGSQPQPGQYVYGIRPEDGEVFCATKEVQTPNGLCFSPQENVVYFSETTTSEISVMKIGKDGTFFDRQVLAVTPELGHGGPDGIKVDSQGNIWCCAQGGIQVYTAKGHFLGLLRTPYASGNLCFGGADMKTLFFGSEWELRSVKTKIEGFSLPD